MYVLEGNLSTGIRDERKWTKAGGFGKVTFLYKIFLLSMFHFFLEKKDEW